ncbi:MAG: lytic murein transglycosylase [bacterium]
MIRKLTSMIIVVAIILNMVALFPYPVFAANECLTFNLSGQSDDMLRQMLAICDAESKETQTQLEAQKNKSSTIAGDVALLDSLIKKAAQQIEIKNQIIAQLGKQIVQKNDKIQTLSGKLEREYDSLGQILRKKNEIDNTTLTEMLLSQYRISDFFLDIDNFHTVNQALQDSVDTVKGVRTETAGEKAALEQKKLEQAQLKLQIEQEKKKTLAQQADKKELLASSKAQEKSYTDLLEQKKAQAGKISAALFKFKGGQGIPFGDAYRFAKEASDATGVSPAFILAILKQESNYGKYDGGCVLIDKQGTGKRLRNGEIIPNVMKPTRDLQPFIQIVEDLGFDVSSQQFSCPITAKVNGKYSDYGGAMGPSQFIPSTWNMFKAKIEAVLNIPHANPWNPEHAIMATALYMKELGAQDSSQERDAACKYYSGRSCRANSNFYGNSVVKLKAQIQKDIDIIESAR